MWMYLCYFLCFMDAEVPLTGKGNRLNYCNNTTYIVKPEVICIRSRYQVLLNSGRNTRWFFNGNQQRRKRYRFITCL